MLELNRNLFLLLNASAKPPGWLVDGVAALASSPVVIAPLLVVALWMWGKPSRRGALIAIAGSVIAAQAVNLILGLLWFDPRPFMIPLGQTLVEHVRDNGFPSDHATLVWTLGAGLWLTRAAPRWGLVTCLFGVAVAWSRIWLGVHFPADMAMSAIVGASMGVGARAVTPVVNQTLLPFADRLYEKTVATAHLPERLVPRRNANSDG